MQGHTKAALLLSGSREVKLGQPLSCTLSFEHAQPVDQCRSPIMNPLNLFSLPPTTSKHARQNKPQNSMPSRHAVGEFSGKPPCFPLSVEFTVTLKSSCPASFRGPRFPVTHDLFPQEGWRGILLNLRLPTEQTVRLSL